VRELDLDLDASTEPLYKSIIASIVTLNVSQNPPWNQGQTLTFSISNYPRPWTRCWTLYVNNQKYQTASTASDEITYTIPSNYSGNSITFQGLACIVLPHGSEYINTNKITGNVNSSSSSGGGGGSGGSGGGGGGVSIGFCQMSLSLNPNIVYPNNPVTAYITVSCPYFTPMGTVMLSINNNTVCQTNLESVGAYTANGSCTFNAPSNPGTYTVYATYAGSGGTVTQPAMLMVNQQPSSGGSSGGGSSGSSGGGSSGSSTTSTSTTTPTTSTPPPSTSGISSKTLLEIGLIAVAGAGIASLIVYSMKKGNK